VEITGEKIHEVERTTTNINKGISKIIIGVEIPAKIMQE
jgi:hypothetical protein